MPSVDSNGTRINYYDAGGSGTPVLFLHAFPFHSGQWEPQLQALGEAHRAITLDLRGFGGSDAPEDRSAYTMESYAGDAVAVLDDASVDKAVVVGLSMGGYIAFELWRRDRDRIAALVLADTRAESDPPEGIQKRSGQQELVSNEGTGGLIEALSGALLSTKTRESKPDVVQRAKELMDNPAAGFIGALEAMKKRPDSTGELTGIDVPTLVLVGEEDGVTPPDAARKIHEHVGGSKLVVVPEAGHISNLEAPDEFNGALADFLREASATW